MKFDIIKKEKPYLKVKDLRVGDFFKFKDSDNCIDGNDLSKVYQLLNISYTAENNLILTNVIYSLKDLTIFRADRDSMSNVRRLKQVNELQLKDL